MNKGGSNMHKRFARMSVNKLAFGLHERAISVWARSPENCEIAYLYIETMHECAPNVFLIHIIYDYLYFKVNKIYE